MIGIGAQRIDHVAAKFEVPERLAGGEPFFAEPRVRPGGQIMKFTPQEVREPEPAPEPHTPPAQTRGWLAYRVQRGTDSWIVRSRPDGSGYVFLTNSRGEHSCPRISPDGSRVAYLSDEGSARPGMNEVSITGLDRKNTLQLTQNAFPAAEKADDSTASRPRYECPVWSPDGKYLAAIYRPAEDEAIYLAVIPTDGQTPAKYIQVEAASDFTSPVWIPVDSENPAGASNQILLIYPRANNPLRVVRIDVDASENLQPAKAEMLLRYNTWDDAQDLVISPDGKRLAISLVYQNAFNDATRIGKAIAKLEVIDLEKVQAISEIDIPNYDPDTAGLGGLAWLPDGRLGLARIDALLGPRKTLFERYDPDAGRLQTKFETLGSFGEITYHADWIEGRWAVFASESGLWAYDLEEARANRASPAMLSGEAITDVDWQ